MGDFNDDDVVLALLEGKITEEEFIKRFDGSVYVPSLRTSLRDFFSISREFLFHKESSQKISLKQNQLD